MAKKRINRNFYTIYCYDYEFITKEDRAAMTDGERDLWEDYRYWLVKKQLPDGRLYSGWGSRYPTKITAEDLPEDYILLSNYKKHGYIRTSGIVDIIYDPSFSHNHAFKDDFLYISYTKHLGEYVGGFKENSTINICDEYIFGNDIINFIFAVEENSPFIDTSEIKRAMVDQYNAYCDEVKNGEGKISKLEELR